MIKSAISSTVYFRPVTTTSIVAKLAVCAILLASIGSAHAAKNDGPDATDAARGPAAHVTLQTSVAKNRTAKKLSTKKLSTKKLSTKKLSTKNLAARKPDRPKADRSKLA